MSDERDTHFVPSARSLMLKLDELFGLLHRLPRDMQAEHAPILRARIETLIAQYTYDVTAHALFVAYADTLGEAHFPAERMRTASDIPDLTTWPEGRKDNP